MKRDRPPLRGPAARELGLPLPPPGLAAGAHGAPRLPLLRSGRPLKRWRYLAAFGPDLMLCAGDARIGPLRQRWWALAEPGRPLLERTSLASAGMSLATVLARPPEKSDETRPPDLAIRASAVDLELRIDADGPNVEAVDVVSPTGGDGWMWTRKQAGLAATCAVTLNGRRRELRLEAVIDDTAGYHERHTAWRWSTGVGRSAAGERLAWNLVSGVHDAPSQSERTVWLDGRAVEVGPARFARDLSGLETADGGHLEFSPWVAREHRMNLVVMRSAYRQPFGTFTGVLPGGIRLAEGYGVMEEHDTTW